MLQDSSDGEHDTEWEAELALWEYGKKAAAKGNMAPLNKMVDEAQAEAREERLEACRRAEEGPTAEMQRVTDLWKALALATIPASNDLASAAGGSNCSGEEWSPPPQQGARSPAHRAGQRAPVAEGKRFGGGGGGSAVLAWCDPRKPPAQAGELLARFGAGGAGGAPPRRRAPPLRSDEGLLRSDDEPPPPHS